MRRVFLCAVLIFISSTWALTQPNWNAPFPAHRVIDNIYYVGTEALGTFLVTTSEGHILINTDYESTVPSIRRSVEELGFAFGDIKIVLGSHAHADHMEADALVKALTGSQVMVMREDVEQLRAMRPQDKEHPVDRILRDGDEVTLGETTLVAHRTPGHTKGCTSWALEVEEHGETYSALIMGSFGVNPDYVLIENPDYPEIAKDYVATFAKARALRVDIFLGAHGIWYDLAAKYDRMKIWKAGDPNPFIDRAGYLAHIDLQERRFQSMLKEQQEKADR